MADPEKPGKKDDWRLAVEIMHDYGLRITQQEQETDLIIELLYDFIKGIEKEAG